MPRAESLRSCLVAIPAWNEAPRIASVIRACLDAEVGPVWVIDDGSSDGTSEIARSAGAEVIRLDTNRGKGGAIAALLESVSTDMVVLIDADLVGLKAHHVRALAEPVLVGRVSHARGLFRDGGWSTTTAQRIAPQLSGQRAVTTEVLAGIEDLSTSRFGVETQIERKIRGGRIESVDVYLDGVSQVVKEAKRGFLPGVWARLMMYGDVIAAQFRR